MSGGKNQHGTTNFGHQRAGGELEVVGGIESPCEVKSEGVNSNCNLAKVNKT